MTWNCSIEDIGFNILAQGMCRAEKTAMVKISLRGNGIREPRSFQKLIRSLPYLEELNLSENCLSGLGAADIFDALKSDPSLGWKSRIRKLSLAHNEVGRGYFLAGILSLRHFFSRNSTLLVLNLEGNSIDDEGVRAIADGMCGNTDAVLERLYLADNLFGDDGAEAIASFMTTSHCLLQVIGLGGTTISNSGAHAILHALAFNTSVLEISGLGSNRVDYSEILIAIETQLSSRVEDAQTLCRIEEVCSKDDTLEDEIAGVVGGIAGISNPAEIDRICDQLADPRQTVDVRHINCDSWALGDPGAASFGRALGITKVLVELRLADNNITATGARDIARGLEENLDSSLEILDLSSNPIGDMGAAVLGFALQSNQTLATVFMHSTGVGDLGADAIASGLINNKGSNVSELYLHDNNIGVAGARSFGALLKCNCKISTLTLQRNNLADDGLKEIICGIEENLKSGLRHLKVAGNSVTDGELFNKIRKLLNRSVDSAPFSEIDPKTRDANNSPTACSTRVALEAEIFLCENNITLAEASDDPVTIREGIESNKKLRVLLPQRDQLPSRKYLERKIQKYDQAMRNLGRLDLEKRLELAAEKILFKTRLTREIKEEERMPHLAETRSLSVSAPGKGIYTQDVLEAMQACDKPQSAAMREASKLGRLSVDSAEEELSPMIYPAWSEDTDDYLRDEGEIRKSMAPNGFDRLALFQSAPLGFVDEETNTQHTIPLLDFDYEARVVKQSLRDAERIGAKIEVEIHAATTDRFSAFFAQGGSRVLHISCHGHPEYLALENGCGDMQPLPVEDLRRFIAIGGGNLEVVFVSACFSRRAGEAFIAAGIKHVVCCRQDQKFRDVAAAEFAKNFYRALACKKSLRQAFYLAKEAVRVSPLVADPRIESDKFLLLPEKPANDEYHDVPVFFTQPVAPRAVLGGGYEDSLRLLPRNPQYFIGREATMYEILDALKHADVVRVAGGDPGIGRSSVVTAVARYILQRQKSFLIDDLFWLPPPQEYAQDKRAPYADLCKLIELLTSSVDDYVVAQEDYKGCWVRIIRELQEKRAILVIDGRHFSSEHAHQNMQRFIRDILHIANVKAIVIDPENRAVKGGTHSRGEAVVEIGPLDFKSSALLFGSLSQYISRRRCPEARTAEEFASLLIPPSAVGEQKQGIVRSRRGIELFKRIGNGYPAAIRSAALNMDESKFSELVRIAKRPEFKVESRAALEQKISFLLREKEGSLKIKNFLRVRDLQEMVEELETIRPQFPSLEELAEQETALNAELDIVVAAKQYELASNVQGRIKLLQNQMSKERFTPGRNLLSPSSGTCQSLSFEGQFRSAHGATDHVARTQQQQQQSSAAFCVSSASDWSRIFVDSGSVVDFDHPAEKTGILCWTNESCDLEKSTEGKALIARGGYALFRDVTSLPSIDDGPWGSSKCRIGNATLIGPDTYDQFRARYVILAVGPDYPCSTSTRPTSSETDGESEYLDEDSTHYIETMLRSAYRSSVELVNRASLAAAAFPIFTAGNPGSELYERTLHIGLQTLVEEIKHSSKLKELHLMASSPEEAASFIRIAREMGLVK